MTVSGVKMSWFNGSLTIGNILTIIAMVVSLFWFQANISFTQEHMQKEIMSIGIRLKEIDRKVQLVDSSRKEVENEIKEELQKKENLIIENVHEISLSIAKMEKNVEQLHIYRTTDEEQYKVDFNRLENNIKEVKDKLEVIYKVPYMLKERNKR